MAEAPDLENIRCGYFVTSEFAELYAYVLRAIEVLNQSLIFTLHCSALFERSGEVQELHLPNLNPIILDPQLPVHILDEIFDNQYGLLHDSDAYENMDGSGWNLRPGTHRYWFKLYPCQPSPTVHPTEQNQSANDDPYSSDEELSYPDRSRSPRNRESYNSLFYALTEHFYRKTNGRLPRKLVDKYQTLRDFGEEAFPMFTELDYKTPMKLQDLPEWHKEVNKFYIRVFSTRGNVLYAKKYGEMCDEIIDLYLNYQNNFCLVLNLAKLFRQSSDRTLCLTCKTWHRNQDNCLLKIYENATEDVRIPDIPTGRHALTMYSDFESIILPSGKHQTSGWAAAAIDKYHICKFNNWQNQLDCREGELIKNYVRYVFDCAKDFALDDGHETTSCTICDLPIFQQEDVIIGRNFINGRPGCNHVKCWNDSKNCMYIFFHNFRGYDSHFLMSEIVANCNVLGLSATSMEKFNMIRVTTKDTPLIQVCFKDTFNFFTCSLAKCISMIENWIYTPEPSRNAKGTFPYDWFDSIDKLKATSLPPAPWYNKLSNSLIDPSPAIKEWRDNGFTTFAQYHDFYMYNDTLQLADAFEEFRRTCIDEFNIDPVHFQGAPGYTWYLGLTHNPDLFKVITNQDIYLDIQSQIRGGISQVMHRYCNVEDKPNESMFFLDVNSLYSKCMTYKLPGRYLRTLHELPKNWQTEYTHFSDKTLLLNVDLVYPSYLHDRDVMYPLAPHKFNTRLCTTFLNKENYLVHAVALDFYLQRGLIIEKFNYAYEFEQDYTLRDYVQSNIEKRRHTKSEVMKTLYKLLNNSIYGKTCENVFKYKKFEVIHDEELISGQRNPLLFKCRNMMLYDENFLCEMNVEKIKLDKPIQIGFTILEFAKLEMYNFLGLAIDHFGEDIKPLYTDTDSILFWCNFSNPEEYFYESPLKELLDFEKVPSHWKVKTKDTDKQSGLWSPEADGKEIVEFCGLRAKTYCYRFRDNQEVIKNKGIPKSAMISKEDDTPEEKITMKHYKNALFTGVEYNVAQYSIRSKKHDVTTIKQYKLGLSANDLKRAIQPDRATSLPFGYNGTKYPSATGLDDPDLFLQ